MTGFLHPKLFWFMGDSHLCTDCLGQNPRANESQATAVSLCGQGEEINEGKDLLSKRLESGGWGNMTCSLTFGGISIRLERHHNQRNPNDERTECEPTARRAGQQPLSSAHPGLRHLPPQSSEQRTAVQGENAHRVCLN